MTCHYCKSFQLSGGKSWFVGNGKYKHIEKTCPVTNKIVSNETKSCSNLIIHDFFFCVKNGQRIVITACLKRHRQQKENCAICKQGDLIVEMMRGKVVGTKKSFSNGLKKRN